MPMRWALSTTCTTPNIQRLRVPRNFHVLEGGGFEFPPFLRHFLLCLPTSHCFDIHVTTCASGPIVTVFLHSDGNCAPAHALVVIYDHVLDWHFGE